MNTPIEVGLYTMYKDRSSALVPISYLQFTDDTLILGVNIWVNIRALKANFIMFEMILCEKLIFIRVCWWMRMCLMLG